MAATVGMDTSQSDTHPPGIINSSILSYGGDVLEVVDEYMEREKHKNNLIIHNLPEPTEVSSNEQRALKDTEVLTGLFHTEFKVTEAKIHRVTWLGAFKSTSARPCLLLVEFGYISIKCSILKQAIKLRRSSKWSDVYISFDFTPNECSHNKKPKDELKVRKSSGEKDIYIKYGKIVLSPSNNTPAQSSNWLASNLILAIANCCSICNKQAELETFLTLQNIDIFIGTGSYLDNTVFNSEVFPDVYNIYRFDRNQHGGGVFILIYNTIPSSQLCINSSNIEIVWAHIHQQNKQDIILASFYCPLALLFWY